MSLCVSCSCCFSSAPTWPRMVLFACLNLNDHYRAFVWPDKEYLTQQKNFDVRRVFEKLMQNIRNETKNKQSINRLLLAKWNASRETDHQIQCNDLFSVLSISVIRFERTSNEIPFRFAICFSFCLWHSICFQRIIHNKKKNVCFSSWARYATCAVNWMQPEWKTNSWQREPL